MTKNVRHTYTLRNDQQSNLEFQSKSVFKLEVQAEFGIQLGIPSLMGINLGECREEGETWDSNPQGNVFGPF